MLLRNAVFEILPEVSDQSRRKILEGGKLIETASFLAHEHTQPKSTTTSTAPVSCPTGLEMGIAQQCIFSFYHLPRDLSAFKGN